jgi:prohibitin 2
MIKVKIRLLSRPNLDRLPDIYRRLGMDYDKRIFESLVFEICGAVIAQFNASQLINQRDTISMNMRQRLIERAREFFIDVDDVSIVKMEIN